MSFFTSLLKRNTRSTSPHPTAIAKSTSRSVADGSLPFPTRPCPQARGQLETQAWLDNATNGALTSLLSVRDHVTHDSSVRIISRVLLAPEVSAETSDEGLLMNIPLDEDSDSRYAHHHQTQIRAPPQDVAESFSAKSPRSALPDTAKMSENNGSRVLCPPQPPTLSLMKPVTVYAAIPESAPNVSQWSDSEDSTPESDDSSDPNESDVAEAIEYGADGQSLSERRCRSQCSRSLDCVVSSFMTPTHLDGEEGDLLQQQNDNGKPTLEFELTDQIGKWAGSEPCDYEPVLSPEFKPDTPPFVPWSPQGQKRINCIRKYLSMPATTSEKAIQDYLGRNVSIIRHLSCRSVAHPDWTLSGDTEDAEVRIADDALDSNLLLYLAISEVYWVDERIADVLSLAAQPTGVAVWRLREEMRKIRKDKFSPAVFRRICADSTEFDEAAKGTAEESKIKRTSRPGSLLCLVQTVADLEEE